MKIEQVISGCTAVFNYANDSKLVQSAFFVFFVIIPFLKVFTIFSKTIINNQMIKENCSRDIPKKLLKIIEKNHLENNLFLVSGSTDFFAVSIGVVTKKIILSRPLIAKTTVGELEAIVLHELHHTHFHHSLLLFFTQVVAAIFFFLPIFKDLQSWAKLEFEKTADRAAVYKQGTTKYIKNALKKAIVTQNNFGMFLQFSYTVLDQRINNLNLKKSKLVVPVLNMVRSFFVILVFVSIFFLNKKYAVASEMEQKITCSLMDCVYQCVTVELTQKSAMSEINFSFDK